MRHGNKQNNLSRTASHRRSLMSNLGSQLITHKRITTTLAKAKALRTYIEPLITKTKANETQELISHNHRIVFSYLNDKAAVKELFTVVGPKIASRPGGYTRIIKLGQRTGDNAELALIELVDFNDVYGRHIETGAEPAKKTRRSRGKKAAEPKVDTSTSTVAKESKESATATEAIADDITLIEGIGPKAAEVLAAAGITTFSQLASAKAEDLKQMLDDSDGSFNAIDTTTWPQQAELAAAGKMDELKALQDELKSGRAE